MPVRIARVPPTATLVKGIARVPALAPACTWPGRRTLGECQPVQPSGWEEIPLVKRTCGDEQPRREAGRRQAGTIAPAPPGGETVAAPAPQALLVGTYAPHGEPRPWDRR